jgi:hypothetical protein
MNEPTDLVYSQNVGCAAGVTVGSGTPHQCEGREAYAVPHRYKFPRPHTARLYVCDVHGRDRAGAEPLTVEDRATIAGRRARRRAQLERAGRLDLIGG